MTINKLAELSGFSIGTVSKAFSGSNEISDATKAKIFEIARQNNCLEKFNNKKFRKPTIGIIVPCLTDFCDAVLMLDGEIRTGGAVPVIFTSNQNRRTEAELLDLTIHFKKTDGVIIVNPTNNIENSRLVTVSIKNKKASEVSDAITLLSRNGHTKISYIGSQNGGFSSALFKKALAENCIRSGSNYYAESDNTTEVSGYETMEFLFGMPNMPTAVIAETDAMASGAEKYIRKRGLKVPKDISVIGLESFNCSADVSKICKAAVLEIFKKINHTNKK